MRTVRSGARPEPGLPPCPPQAGLLIVVGSGEEAPRYCRLFADCSARASAGVTDREGPRGDGAGDPRKEATELD